MRSDLIMMACLAAFAVAMVATAGDPSPLDSVAGTEPTTSARAETASPETSAETSPESSPEPLPSATEALAPSEEISRLPPTLAAPARCTGNCAVQAGYQWAQARQIIDADDCDQAPEALIEGCKTFADEQTQVKGDRDIVRKLD